MPRRRSPSKNRAHSRARWWNTARQDNRASAVTTWNKYDDTPPVTRPLTDAERAAVERQSRKPKRKR